LLPHGLAARLELKVDTVFVGLWRGHWCRVVKEVRAVTLRKYMRPGAIAVSMGTMQYSSLEQRNRRNVSIPRYGPGEDIWEQVRHGKAPRRRTLVFTGTWKADQTVELRDEIITTGVETFDWYGLMELFRLSLTGLELLAASLAHVQQRHE